MDSQAFLEEAHLKDYIDVLRRRRDVALLFLITVVLVVTLGSFIMKPVYRATTTILIDEESPNILTTSGSVSLESQNYYSYKEYYQSQIEIITAISIARKVFNEFGLGASPKYQKAKEPLKKFLKTVKVEPVRDTRLVRLNVENEDPALAANIANRIAEIYVRRNLYYINRNELMSLLKNEYLKLEQKLSEYTKVYKEKHPEMIRLKKEMSEMADKIEKSKNSTFDFDMVPASGASAGAGGTKPLEGFKANNVSIQDPAEKPVIPVRPKKKLNILIALIVGALGGIGCAFFFEYLDDTVKSAEDVERITKWPWLGNIPTINEGGKSSEFEKDLLVHLNPKDPIAEAYRAIRTNVLFCSTEERPVKCVVITSAGPQEGKTTTLCNLGVALAQTGKKVLLVDADIRKPRLHETFKAENNNGLSNFLSAQEEFDKVVQKTAVENLSLVKGGPHPPNPSELLSSHKLKEFIVKAKEKFDFILFDSPPIAVVTDAMIISKVVDGVIMTVECGKTPKRALIRLASLLNSANARIIGVVPNKISLAPGSYYYYYSRYYGKK